MNVKYYKHFDVYRIKDIIRHTKEKNFISTSLSAKYYYISKRSVVCIELFWRKHTTPDVYFEIINE